MFKTKYRITRDKYLPYRWQVQTKRWWFPFWLYHGNGLLPTPEDAEDLIRRLKTIY